MENLIKQQENNDNVGVRTYTFHVHGMHCKSCVVLTESELVELEEISNVKASLKNLSVEVTGDFGDKEPKHIASDLSQVLKPHGYTLSLEKQIRKNPFTDFKYAIPISIGFVIFFVLLQKIGIINLVNTTKISFGTSFLIGVVASLSTCMAVVGGLVLSMSASFAKDGSDTLPQILFHLGRLISFFILGGVIGALGSAFTLGTGSTFALSLIIGIVMIILGLNLLDFHFAKKFQPTMPKFLSKKAFGISKLNHTLTPLLVGIATFFLPCGFTQSMQIYTLSTGGFFSGALTMFSFALGTLPVLALVSFSSLSVHNSRWSGVFFKTAGIIVIMFALFNIINGLVVIGLIPPIFNF